MTNSLRPLLLAALAALIPLAACGGGDSGSKAATGGEPSVPEAQRYGGTMVVGQGADVTDINPLTSSDNTSAQWQQFVLFMPLITYNEKLEPIPYLARSWEVNADTSLLTFHLRNDVYWHDGVKTTAADVKFSYDLARDPKTAFPNASFWTYYGDSEAPDSFTFRVKLKPHSEFMDPWRAFAPVPEHILKGVAPAQMRNHPFSTSKPVGNGPFKFVSRAPGENWVFAANERFPKELGGRPYVDRLVYRNIPEPTTLLTELLTGGVDYLIAPPPSQVPQIKASRDVRLVTFPNRSFVVIAWNERRPPFDDVRVRRALTMAIDRESVIKGILYGYGDLANTTVPPFYWQYDPGAGADLKYDPEGAKRLLAEAGWTDRNGDGVVENAQGKPLQFTLKTNKGNAERADISEKVQADLKKVGVAVEPRLVEFNTLIDQMDHSRDFDAAMMGWITEFRIDDSDLLACSKRDQPFQWVGYCDPQTDSLLSVLPTIANRDAAKPLWSRYQRKVSQDQPYTFMYYQQRLEALRNRIQGVHLDARGDWVGAREWWIVPSQRGASTAAAPK